MEKATVIKNKMGHIHIFRGWNRKILQDGKYTFKTVSGESADVYLQTEIDICEFEKDIPFVKLDSLNNGYQINWYYEISLATGSY